MWLQMEGAKPTPHADSVEKRPVDRLVFQGKALKILLNNQQLKPVRQAGEASPATAPQEKMIDPEARARK